MGNAELVHCAIVAAVNTLDCCLTNVQPGDKSPQAEKGVSILNNQSPPLLPCSFSSVICCRIKALRADKALKKVMPSH